MCVYEGKSSHCYYIFLDCFAINKILGMLFHLYHIPSNSWLQEYCNNMKKKSCSIIILKHFIFKQICKLFALIFFLFLVLGNLIITDKHAGLIRIMKFCLFLKSHPKYFTPFTSFHTVGCFGHCTLWPPSGGFKIKG